MTNALIVESGWALTLSTIAISTIGSVLPFSPIEPFLLALPAMAPRAWLIPLALLATACHMAGKALLYFASRGAARAIPQRYRAHVDRTRERLLSSTRAKAATILASSAIGIPPLYLVTVLCGALRVPFIEFLILATIGRAARFVALVTIPTVVGRWMDIF